MDDLERYWCVAIRHGGKLAWTRAWKASVGDQWLSQRTKILSAMTCSQDKNRLKNLISRIFDSEIEQDPKENFVMIEKLAVNPIGRSMALNFLKTNWNILDR